MNRGLGWIVIAADGCAVIALRPDLSGLATHCAAPRTWITQAGPDSVIAALATAGLWFAAVWVALGLVAGFAGRLPGLWGRAAQRTAVAVFPAVLRRVIAATVGLGFVLVPVAAGAQAPTGRVPGISALGGTGVAELPGPVWPSAPLGSTSGDLIPAPIWPQDSPPAPPTHPAPVQRSPTAPAAHGTPPGQASPPKHPSPPGQASPPKHPSPPEHASPRKSAGSSRAPGPSAPRRADEPGPKRPRSTSTPSRPQASSSPRADELRVRPGDSLWMIAAHRLGVAVAGGAPSVADPSPLDEADAAAIASYWPQVYAANRGAIGGDPNLITPGQVLHLPPPNSQERS